MVPHHHPRTTAFPSPLGRGADPIGGAQLSPGYYRSPQLTHAAYVPHPFREGATLYRTGAQPRSPGISPQSSIVSPSEIVPLGTMMILP